MNDLFITNYNWCNGTDDCVKARQPYRYNKYKQMLWGVSIAPPPEKWWCNESNDGGVYYWW